MSSGIGDAYAEVMAHIVGAILVVILGIFLVTILITRGIYNVKYIEDSACRSGYIYVLVEEENGTRTWNATEARCNEEKEKQ